MEYDGNGEFSIYGENLGNTGTGNGENKLSPNERLMSIQACQMSKNVTS